MYLNANEAEESRTTTFNNKWERGLSHTEEIPIKVKTNYGVLNLRKIRPQNYADLI